MLNAVIDAQLAEAVVHHLRGQPSPAISPEVLSRADDFMQGIDHRADRDQRLMVLAYTLERVNGRADYLTAGIFQHRLLAKHRLFVDQFVAEHSQNLTKDPLPYQEDRFQPKVVFQIGIDLMRGDFRDVQEYAQQRGLALTLPGRDIVAGVRLVQLRNIRYNNQVSNLLLSGAETHLPKVHAIRQAAGDTRFPRVFIGAAALTQRAAARWDRAFAMILRARFRI